MPIKVIAFDLWSTLISGSPPDIMEEIAAKLSFDTTQDFWDYCDKHYFNCKIKPSQMLRDIAKEKGGKTNVEKLTSLWESTWDSIYVYSDTVPALEKIRKKYKTTLISNSGSEEGKRVLKIFGLAEYFDYIIMSYEVGLAKPDPEIFRLVTKKFSVKPEEVVYVGDGFQNDFLGGKNAGFKTFLIDRRDKHPQFKKEDWYIESLDELLDKI